jgi:hypothetical protein
MAIISLETTVGVVQHTDVVNFTLVEMPYGCKGYRFNGSSSADPAELGKYWDLVDVILSKNSLTSENYITLLSITQ